MTAAARFMALSERTRALARDLTEASADGPDEFGCHILRLKALTLERYATELQLLAERLERNPG